MKKKRPMKKRKSWKTIGLAGVALAALAAAVVLFGSPTPGGAVATVYKSPT